MKFKLDENLPLELAKDLRLSGYDVDTVIEEGIRGAEDSIVIQAALSADRILMTLDKGIPTLLQNPNMQHAGVVLFRPDASGRAAVASFIRSRLAYLLSFDLTGRLTVVTATRVRIR